MSVRVQKSWARTVAPHVAETVRVMRVAWGAGMTTKEPRREGEPVLGAMKIGMAADSPRDTGYTVHKKIQW